MIREILKLIKFWKILIRQILIQVHKVANRNLKIHIAEEVMEQADNKLIASNNEIFDYYKITYCYYMGIFYREIIYYDNK